MSTTKFPLISFRYDRRTGTFTVPPGGDGFYYFSAYFVVFYYEYARLNIQINGKVICTANADQVEVSDYGQAACSAAKVCKQILVQVGHG